ncbi:unnamed protein product [Symbiodinium sp. CCMP2592]|nr:unnamed protein product [Symbiodinium sp. CCMP2592]
MDGAAVGDESYATALRERLQSVQAEVEVQRKLALAVKQELDRVQAEAEQNQKELAEVRRRWADEQPEREALLRETGEAERRFAARERRCAEALARLPAAEAAAEGPGGPSPSLNGGRGSELAAKSARVASLEASRQQLSSGLQELQDAVRQETTLITQLTSRCEVLRRETKALGTGAGAAREAEARAWRKLAALEAAEAAAKQREHSLDRQGKDLQDQVRALRLQLDAASAIPPVNGFAHVTSRMEENAWELLRKLESKVGRLREELREKQEELELLRLQRLRAEPAAEDRLARQEGVLEQQSADVLP